MIFLDKQTGETLFLYDEQYLKRATCYLQTKQVYTPKDNPLQKYLLRLLKYSMGRPQ